MRILQPLIAVACGLFLNRSWKLLVFVVALSLKLIAAPLISLVKVSSRTPPNCSRSRYIAERWTFAVQNDNHRRDLTLLFDVAAEGFFMIYNL